jgi:hypothetical protein
VKKEDSLDLKLDTSKLTLHAARAKPKLTTTHSESTLTVFANGHHKPCHRNNNSAHISGLPYKISRPHTLHGSAAFASFAQGNSFARSETLPQRSMDTLSLSDNDFHAMFGSNQRSVDSLAVTPIAGSLDANGVHESLFTSQSTIYGQEGDSPNESQLSDATSMQQWPWASTISPINRNYGFGSLSTSPSQDCLPNLDNEWAIPSASLTNPLWSAGDLPLDPSKLSDTFTQPISHSGESHKQSNPGLTTASSSHSEMGEPILFGDLDIRPPQSAASETLFWEDNPVFRFPTSGPNEISHAPTSMPAYNEDVKQASAVSTAMTSIGSTDVNPTYTTAEFSNACAIALPNSINDVVGTDWGLVPNNIYVEPDNFDMNFSGWI